MVDKPLNGIHVSSAFLGIYLCGCLFASALSFTVWRIHPFKPSRYAIRLVYCRLAELARDNARLIRHGAPDAEEWSRQASHLRVHARAALQAAPHTLLHIPP